MAHSAFVAGAVELRRALSGLCCVAAALLVITAPAEPAEALNQQRIIVNRTKDSIAIYVALPASTLPTRFGGIPSRLEAGPEGLDVRTLNTGTIDIADWLISRSDARLDGKAVLLEPLSVMVHPMELGLPFETPRDGAIATSVCTAPLMNPRPLEDLTLFAGFYLYPVDGAASLMLRLGEAAPAGSVSLASFWDWTPKDVTETTAAPNGWIDLGEGPVVPALVGASGAVFVAVLAGLTIVGMVAVFVAPRRRRDTENAPTG